MYRYNVPQGTKSLALVVEDIDAPDPSGPLVPWTIWVVVDIPPDMKGLPEGFSGNDEQDVAGIREGNNDHKIPGWRGPLMPSHDHRFQFKLFALSDKPNLGHTVILTNYRLDFLVKFNSITEVFLNSKKGKKYGTYKIVYILF